MGRSVSPSRIRFLGASEPTTQTASRVVQPFLHSSALSVSIPLSPQNKIVSSHRGIWTPHTTRGSLGPPRLADHTPVRKQHVASTYVVLRCGLVLILPRIQPSLISTKLWLQSTGESSRRSKARNSRTTEEAGGRRQLNSQMHW